MEKPKLRPLEAFPVNEGGQMMLALRDPSGISDVTARLPPAAVAVIQLCTGELTRDEICKLFLQRYGQDLSLTTLDRLIEQLDQAMLLDSPRFAEHASKVVSEFAQLTVRPAVQAGKGYPADPAELKLALDRWYTAANGPGAPRLNHGVVPLAVIAPHLDIMQAGPAYAWAYRAIAEAAEPPELVVLFGTTHAGGEQPLNFTHKDFSTPLGVMHTDVELLDKLVERMTAERGPDGAQSLMAGEFHHRGEHSIEMHLIWLQHALGERANQVKILPILCSSMSGLIEEGKRPEAGDELHVMLKALTELTAGKRVVWVAAAEISHVGPRYGDEEAMTRDDCTSLESRDRQTLATVERGDATAWFDEIAREQDARRVSGLAPIYALLTASSAKNGQQLVYGQCAADEKNQSIVSIVAYNFPVLERPASEVN